ncbi:metal-dependent hydrolase family protein [Sphingomonas colocasiae]|uniref:Amidohydrolase family protein n=1 Tax=Sphingomonas colocasiae TaxID=1848973 RepID=A0ABS7PQU1_9SPHN|nr:amidohydrolase family protein [Sphingomonas colocasiae]
MKAIVFENARVLNEAADGYREDCHVVVEDGRIMAVDSGPARLPGADSIDVRGGVLMPGLIDVHTHPRLSSASAAQILGHPPSYSTAHAARMLRHAIDCGFTTIRDVGGADHGLARALEDGLIVGPRLFYAGRTLSMTGGHGDLRTPEQDVEPCRCHLMHSIAHIVDGADSVRRAAREELRMGAHCIKIMMSGGVLSPTDPIWMAQFTDDEILAAIEEAVRWRAYVAAHAHTADAVMRAARLGVRTVEHATLITAEAAAMLREAGGFAVPTLAIVMALIEKGDMLGLPAAVRGKAKELTQLATQGFETAWRAGVPLGFGTDLPGELFVMQAREFLYRREVQPAHDVLRSATVTGAEILRRPDLGRIAPGATADLLVVDGDPLADIALLAEDGRRLSTIMKAGRFHKRPHG